MEWPVIRSASLTDAEAMTSCVTAAYGHYVPRIGLAPAPMLTDYAEEIQKHHAFVLEVDKRIIGVLILHIGQDGVLLHNVALHPRFQKRGYGRMLIAFAEQEAQKLGFESIMLYTHELMAENITLYESLGYVEYERGNYGPYRRVYMRKLLAP